MTVSKRGLVPKAIKEAVQEQFSHMGENYTTLTKSVKKDSITSFSVFRELSNEPEPIIYTFTLHVDEIRYISCDLNSCEATQSSLPNSGDAFFQFMFTCDLPLEFEAFTEIFNLITAHGLDVTAFYK